MSAVSDQYAVALFELALEHEATKDIRKAFAKFHESLDAENMNFFMHPNIAKLKKQALIDSFDFPQLFKDFLKVLVQNSRFNTIEEIRKSYEKLVDQLDATMRIEVFTGKPMHQDRISNLEKVYGEKYNRKVVVKTTVDSKITGGMRVEYNGMVLNDTVNHSLNKLKSRLTK